VSTWLVFARGTAVNDAPVYQLVSAASAPIQVNVGDAVSTPWATAVSAGPANEASQRVAFAVSGGDTAIARVTVHNTTGVLTVEGLSAGQTVFSVQLVDDGGTAFGGMDRSPAVEIGVVVAPASGMSVWMLALVGALLALLALLLVILVLRWRNRKQVATSTAGLEVLLGTVGDSASQLNRLLRFTGIHSGIVLPPLTWQHSVAAAAAVAALKEKKPDASPSLSGTLSSRMTLQSALDRIRSTDKPKALPGPMTLRSALDMIRKDGGTPLLPLLSARSSRTNRSLSPSVLRDSLPLLPSSPTLVASPLLSAAPTSPPVVASASGPRRVVSPLQLLSPSAAIPTGSRPVPIPGMSQLRAMRLAAIPKPRRPGSDRTVSLSSAFVAAVPSDDADVDAEARMMGVLPGSI
jgi:hypothetical protein